MWSEPAKLREYQYRGGENKNSCEQAQRQAG